MKRLIIKAVALLCVASIVLVACSQSDKESEEKETTTTKAKSATDTSTKDKSIVEIATSSGDFSSLLSVVNQAGLGELLSGKGTYTVFAPSNDAFAKIDPATMTSLQSNQTELTKVLTYHALATEILLSSDFEDGQVLTTAEGSKLTLGVKDGKYTVTTDAGVTANIVKADIEGSNGVIHVIDSVLIPANLSL